MPYCASTGLGHRPAGRRQQTPESDNCPGRLLPPGPVLAVAGWYGAARQLEISNSGSSPCGDAQIGISRRVIHSISPSPATGTWQWRGARVQQLFTNLLDWDAHPPLPGYTSATPEVLARISLPRARARDPGSSVSCDDRAWHAGVSQRRRARESVCKRRLASASELEGLEGL